MAAKTCLHSKSLGGPLLIVTMRGDGKYVRVFICIYLFIYSFIYLFIQGLYYIFFA